MKMNLLYVIPIFIQRSCPRLSFSRRMAKKKPFLHVVDWKDTVSSPANVIKIRPSLFRREGFDVRRWCCCLSHLVKGARTPRSGFRIGLIKRRIKTLKDKLP